jgi:hypothetical protein
MLMRNFIPANFCLIVCLSFPPPSFVSENKFVSYYFSIKNHAATTKKHERKEGG